MILLWKINEAFLKKQTDAGKTIIFSHNPNFDWGGSDFAKEIQFLRANNYKISEIPNPDGYFYAIPNRLR